MADMGDVRFVSEDKTDRIIGVVVALCMTAIVTIALLSACSTGDTESGDASTAYTESGAPRFTQYLCDGEQAGRDNECNIRVIQDNQTGVRYLYVGVYGSRGRGVGVCPLLNSDGTPNLDPEAGMDYVTAPSGQRCNEGSERQEEK